MSFQLSLRREILTLPRENTARSSSSRLSPLSVTSLPVEARALFPPTTRPQAPAYRPRLPAGIFSPIPIAAHDLPSIPSLPGKKRKL